MTKADLDSKQLLAIQAVLSTDSSVLVLGRPGTGKTTTALWAAREFLDQAEGSPRPRVLFLTFSRSAVSQISARSPGVIVPGESTVEIATFHGLAYRILRTFSRYMGYGNDLPSIQSEARLKLLGRDGSQFTYQDLVPAATRMFQASLLLKNVFATRWPLIICDEVQDTSTEQWKLLQQLAPRKLLLLGDPHQMIYTFIPGVSLDRFSEIKDAADTVVELSPRSYRDPSDTIPALAEAIRNRQFNADEVREALDAKRLEILVDIDDEKLNEELPLQIQKAQSLGAKEIGIFVHSNAAVMETADQLISAGIDHALVGIGEAHAEALSAMVAQCLFSVGGVTLEDVKEALALFLTSVVRGREPPDLAQALVGRGDLPDLVTNALESLELALKTVDGSIGELLRVVRQSWPGLGIRAGYRPWRRAASHFQRLGRPFRNQEISEDSVVRLVSSVDPSRVEALIDIDYSEHESVNVMNYHQTKGREADVVIHLFKENDYFGPESEPFETTSRLLNVAISRARQTVIVILPPNPHPVVAPFASLPPALN